MPGHDPGRLLDPHESTRESLDSLETRFRRVYGREMTPEERKYFALAEPITPFALGETPSHPAPEVAEAAEPAVHEKPAENPEGKNPDEPKAA